MIRIVTLCFIYASVLTNYFSIVFFLFLSKNTAVFFILLFFIRFIYQKGESERCLDVCVE